MTLRSPLPPQAVAERVRANVKRWNFAPFYSGPVGGFWFGRLRLRWVASFFEYNAKPVLVGTIDAAATGSVLNLAYRGPSGDVYSTSPGTPSWRCSASCS